MEQNEKTIVLLDGTILEAQNTMDEMTNGVLFFFRKEWDPSIGLDLDQVAGILAASNIAVIQVTIQETKYQDAADIRDLLIALKEHFSAYDPWFVYGAEGEACGLLNECLQAYGPKGLAYLFVDPDETVKEPDIHPMIGVMRESDAAKICVVRDNIVFIRVLSGEGKEQCHLQKAQCEDDRAGDAGHSDPDRTAWDVAGFYLRVFRYIRKRSWESLYSAMEDERYIEVSTPILEQDLIRCMLEGNGEAALILSHISSVQETENLREWDSWGNREETEKSLQTLWEAEEKIRKNWRQNWPRRFFWVAVAAWKGEPAARRALVDHLLYDLTKEEKDSVLTILPLEAKEKRSYACILLGLLAESGEFPYEKPDPETALSFYREARNLCDPEGSYRIGRLLELNEHKEDEAFPFYREAADAGYPPAMMRVARELTLHPDKADYSSEARDYYEEVAMEEDLPLAWVHLAKCYEAEGDHSGMVEAYANAVESLKDGEDKERDWRYSIGNDREGVFWPAEEWEEPEISSLQFLLGKFLLEHPDLENETSAAEYFQMAAEEELSHVLDDEEDEEDCRKDVQRGGRKNPTAGEEMYYLGICRMHGTGCEQKPASAIACLRLAEALGNEKAGEELSFWKEAQRFLEEAQGHEADEAMRRKEAMYRLQMLTHMGLSETALEAFSKNGTVCFAYDDDCGVSFPDPEEERTREIQDEIKTLEHMHNATAYLVQMTAPLWITHVSVFYVSDRTDEWEFDRKQILDLSPYVYAFDMQYDSKDYCADIGPIGISVHQGGMERTW